MTIQQNPSQSGQRVVRWVCESCFQVFADTRHKNFRCDQCYQRPARQSELRLLYEIKVVAEEAYETARRDLAACQSGAISNAVIAHKLFSSLKDIEGQLRWVLERSL